VHDRDDGALDVEVEGLERAQRCPHCGERELEIKERRVQCPWSVVRRGPGIQLLIRHAGAGARELPYALAAMKESRVD
jgi:hypothetical protein